MIRKAARRLREMTLRGKLVAALATWTAFVLLLTAGYTVMRFGALTEGLSPTHLMQSRDVLGAMLWLAGALSVATLIFSVVIARYILHPVSALARAVREVKPGVAHIPLPHVVTRDRDLWELTQAFDQMAYALNERDAALQQTLRDRERQLNELSTIAKFVEGCAQFQDGAELYRHITMSIAGAVDAEVCFILRYEKGSNEMAAQTPGHGIQDDRLAAIRYHVTPEIRSAWDFKAQGALLCNDPQSDQRIVKALIRPLGFYNLIVVPFYFQRRVTGLIVAANKPRWLTHEDARLLSVFANHTSCAVANLNLYQEIQQHAVRDGLTGLHNYRHFRQQIERIVQQARRYGSPLSMLMIDLDNFKSYNDSYGHLSGDAILKEIAALLLTHTRSSDLVVRYGGEEFAVLLPETGEEQAHGVGEKIRQVIEEHPFALAVGEMPRSLTISVGVASAVGEVTADALIQRADDALYRAKESGRNRVIMSKAA